MSHCSYCGGIEVEYWVDHVSNAVRFTEAMEALDAMKPEVFLEIGAGFANPGCFFVGKRPLKQVFPPYFPGGTNGIPGVDPGMVVLSDCFAKTTCNVLKQNRVMMPLHVCPKRGRPPRFCGALKGRKEPTTHHVDLICWQQPACWQMLLPGVSRVYGIQVFRISWPALGLWLSMSSFQCSFIGNRCCMKSSFDLGPTSNTEQQVKPNPVPQRDLCFNISHKVENAQNCYLGGQRFPCLSN